MLLLSSISNFKLVMGFLLSAHVDLHNPEYFVLRMLPIMLTFLFSFTP